MTERERARARAWYRVLLRAFPEDVHRRFGPDMEQLFVDRLREVRGRPAGVATLWISAAADVLGAAARERAGRAWRWIADTWAGGGTMEGWIQDVRFGVRTLARRRGFTLAATVTLALGIGANVAIFSVVHGVLLTPLDYPDSERLVSLWTTDRRDGSRGRSVDHPDVRRLQAAVPGLAVAGHAATRPTLTGLGDPQAVYGSRVTDGLITLMGYQPQLGRDLVAADDVPDGPTVLVVSHDFWTNLLGRDPDVVGRSVTLSGQPYEVVGVAPPGFDYPSGAEFWVPRRHDPADCGHGCRIMAATGRLDASLGLEEAQARLDGVAAALAEEFPDSHRDDRITLERLIDTEVADVRSGLWVLLGAVAMVLLIACANVANLLLARASARAGEVALRATLGAGRGRIARQLLTESLLLATLSGALGVSLATWGTRVLIAMAPESLPRLDQAGLDGAVLLFAAALVLVVTGAFGVLPALQISGTPLAGALTGSRRAAGSGRSSASRSFLLAGEVALSLALLLGAGLLFRTLGEIRTVDLGFAAERVERFRFSTPDSRYDSLGTVRFQEELEARLSAIRGVRAAGIGFGVPLASGNIGTSFSLLDRPRVASADLPVLSVRPSTPGLLEASGMSLVRGRWFTPADRRDAPGVAVINETAARTYYADSDPIGKRLHADVSWGFATDPERTIVGVVGDVRARTATAEPEAAVYVPNAQFAANSVYAVIRLGEGIDTAMPAARDAVRALDPELALTDVHRIEDVVAEELAATRFYLTLVTLFSALALVLAAVGLYGVVAYSVGQRTREIGIRIALGARDWSVTDMVLRQGVRPALAGIALGLLLAWAGARLLGSLLYGVEPTDMATIVSSTAVLLVVVFLATLLPARRAARIPPAVALRSE